MDAQFQQVDFGPLQQFLVAAALDNIKEIIERADLKYNVVTWPEQYKGIDDFLLARKSLKE